MFGATLRKLGLLLYKNYLVRKRQWVSALLGQILVPLFFIYTVRNVRISLAPSSNAPQNITYPIEYERDIINFQHYNLFVAPDNEFTRNFTTMVQKCTRTPDHYIKRFKSEQDLIEKYLKSKEEEVSNVLGFVVDNLGVSTVNLKYKILTPAQIPTVPYFSKEQSYITYGLDIGFTGLQLCLDKSFLEMNNRNPIDIKISMQSMPKPAVQDNGDSEVIDIVITVFIVLAFLFQFCIETSKASSEKFLGVNVLMAMNGVPNYLNLLSWLISGLIFSLFYVIPIILLFYIDFGESVPILYNGNLFIFWLILTLHLAHLFTFGMHIAAYFARSQFLSIVLLITHGATTGLNYYLRQNYSSLIPYLGLIFPNILLCRACEEIVYYQIVSNEGLHFNNLFKIDNPAYGAVGSIGVVMIFSILGAFIHFILANYIYAVNPGKYGAKKHPLYFLEYFKKSENPNNYNEVEDFEFSNLNNKPFETVNESAYTPGIQIRNLKKIYNVGLIGDAKVHALKGISIDFYQGQITSLLGHNGAGKTTMMSILTGMISPSDGLVLINGKNIKDHMDEIMLDMGLCPQENIVFPNLSVYEQLKFFAMLKNKNKSNSVIESNVKSLLETLKLYEKRDILPKKLSGGQKRRVCLGMALVGDSSTLILDEPTSGLDPEIRREIWDILLKTRGEKTILISTHDMEEADILGDRIAIVHSGKLRSYGSTLFLKKLLGRGNVEVTLSTESWCNPESIRTYLGSQSEILNTDGSKVVLSVPNSAELPDALDRVESHKRNLGVTGMSVSLITLEQVFLEVTKDNVDKTDSREPLISASHQLSGFSRSLQAAKALFFKKSTYALKNLSTILVMTAIILFSLLVNALIFSIDLNSTTIPDPIDFKLSSYNQPNTFYRTDDQSKMYGEAYAAVTKQYGGQAIADSQNDEINEALLAFGNQNYDNYSTHIISSVEFNTTATGLNVKFMPNIIKTSYSKPIALNLMSNTLLRMLVDQKYSIDITGQQFPHKINPNETLANITVSVYIQIYGVPIVLLIGLFLSICLINIQPVREAITNIKHLQKMTGLSSINYWGTTFLFDFGLMFILTILLIIGFIILDKIYDVGFMHAKEIFVLMGLILLFVMSALPLMYSSTFVEYLKSTTSSIIFFALIPFLLAIVEGIMILLSTFNGLKGLLKFIRPVQKIAFMLTPYVSLLHGQISYFQTSLKNAACRKLSNVYEPPVLCNPLFFEGLCCKMNCTKGDCQHPMGYFNGFDKEISFDAAVLYLCLTPFMYFIILWVLDNKLIQTIISRSASKASNSDEVYEEQVKKVKRNIANEIADIKSKSASGHATTNRRTTENEERHVFLVSELRKQYGNLLAVKDINFGVNLSECFGLLGVNGAGKSTTFRMMTGEEIPDIGSIFLNEKELSGSSDRSQMGYCPQNDAIIPSLNAYAHLRLFARLRGIPEIEVNNEVNKWIKRMNLNACASQPSGTYSGGNKRRLNIAIAMIGIPDLVLLDEPTTGVDPAARRSLWNVIKSSQSSTGQAVVLTSHSMEECEALCARLAIMVGGEFVCIGPSEELKQRFGAGYDIQVKLNPEKAKAEMEAVKRDIEAALQCELIDEHSGYLMYHVSSTSITWRKMYDVMSAVKHKFNSIEDFSVLSSTLEQLFLLFARSANKSH